MVAWTTEHFGKEKPHFNLARMKAGGESFEVVVHPEAALAFRQSQGKADIHDVLVYDRIFADAKKGLAASEHIMKSVFNTVDPAEVARQIILKGEVQLTSEYRDNLREAKRKAIVNIIHRMAIDPKTGFPIPQSRIEAAMEEAKVRIDEHASSEDQVQAIVRQLMPVLPIKFEVRQVEFHIPAQFAAKAHPILKGFGSLQKDSWQSDGSLLAVVEVPAGLQQELFSELNRLCHGSVESKVVGARQ
ncbi:ribosome assembly factor SBDS [Candidatus Woesearchaeota archaeon]|nr:ribosome assembly factor SBDS [Candidatus Woesearchaeota archaeon]